MELARAILPTNPKFMVACDRIIVLDTLHEEVTLDAIADMLLLAGPWVGHPTIPVRHRLDDLDRLVLYGPLNSHRVLLTLVIMALDESTEAAFAPRKLLIAAALTTGPL